MAGLVRVDGRKEEKAGVQIDPEARITVTERDAFVSRGGLKLERAFEEFGLDVTGRVVLDAGASTGGFTDCLLRHGAARVIAIDVGYGQLDWKLRQDPRVTVLERTNIRYLEPRMLPVTPELATLDLSFISLKKVLAAVIKCLSPGFEIVALIKPQFEAGRGQVGKGGVVRDMAIHRRVLAEIWQLAVEEGCGVVGVTDSGLPGPSGNVEYLMHLVDGAASGQLPDRLLRDETLDALVEQVRKTQGGG